MIAKCQPIIAQAIRNPNPIIDVSLRSFIFINLLYTSFFIPMNFLMATIANINQIVRVVMGMIKVFMVSVNLFFRSTFKAVPKLILNQTSIIFTKIYFNSLPVWITLTRYFNCLKLMPMLDRARFSYTSENFSTNIARFWSTSSLPSRIIFSKSLNSFAAFVSFLFPFTRTNPRTEDRMTPFNSTGRAFEFLPTLFAGDFNAS